MTVSPRDTDTTIRKCRRAAFALGFAVSAAVGLDLASSTALTQEADPAHADAAKAHKDKAAKPPPRKAAGAVAPAQGDAPVPAPERALPMICILNRQEINQVSTITTSSSKRLEGFRLEAQTEIDKARAAIDADYKALLAQKPPPSDESLKAAKGALEDRLRTVSATADLKRRQIDATREAVNAQVMAATATVLHAVEKERSCVLTLSRDAVVDADGAPDITASVIAAMNAQLNPLPFNLVAATPVQPAAK